MSITKQYLKNNAMCKVRFKVSKEMANGAQECSVAGDFNEWNPENHTMKANKDGSFAVAINLEAPGKYEFRYLVDKQNWITDTEADDIVDGPFADAKNSVVIL